MASPALRKDIVGSGHVVEVVSRACGRGESDDQSGSDDGEGETSSSSDGHEYASVLPQMRTLQSSCLDVRISKMIDATAERDPEVSACRAHLFLAMSVGCWLVIAGLPIYMIPLSYAIFGQRGSMVQEFRAQLNNSEAGGWLPESQTQRALLMDRLRVTCASTDYGKMINLAPPGDMPTLVPWNGTEFGNWKDAEE
mmetsp:Transcript_98912/g.284205  ORF Transcript_98912/g.284205 Transcript_98912/m.284205 type:complete len:196 (+) Transcript_98912:2-589(+)